MCLCIKWMLWKNGGEICKVNGFLSCALCLSFSLVVEYSFNILSKHKQIVFVPSTRGGYIIVWFMFCSIVCILVGKLSRSFTLAYTNTLFHWLTHVSKHRMRYRRRAWAHNLLYWTNDPNETTTTTKTTTTTTILQCTVIITMETQKAH